MQTKSRFRNALLLSISSIVSLLILEIALRLFLPTPSNEIYKVWPSNLKVEFSPDPEIMPGISGKSTFTTNGAGIRGDLPSGKDHYRILTIGGSTTECLYLDDSETWPHILKGMINDNYPDLSIRVGNVGKSGHNTRHHILQVKKLLHQYPDTDLVILLIGVNDLQIRLSRDKEFRVVDKEDYASNQKLLNEAFFSPPGWDEDFPAYKHTEIWRLLRKAKQGLNLTSSNLVQDKAGQQYARWRQHRKSARAIRDTLPDLSIALDEYRHNIHTLIDMAQAENTRVVFATQPTMWRNDLPQELAALLWSGGIGQYQIEPGKDYYSISALAEAMKMYNEVLLDVCIDREVLCVDLASTLAKDGTVFYDDFHFNESGARRVASLISQSLLEKSHMDLRSINTRLQPLQQAKNE